MGLSPYHDLDEVAREVAQGHHRDLVGGLWDEIGQLQFDFLVEKGLRREQRFLDIGCGCLRGGVHFAEYLDPGNYFGTDISQALIDAGDEVELVQRGLQIRVPKSQLRCDDSFNFSAFGTRFDMALAQSLFTHLPKNRFGYVSLGWPKQWPWAADFMRPSSSFPMIIHSANRSAIRGRFSYDHADPYHYRFRDICRWCTSLPWRPVLIGD